MRKNILLALPIGLLALSASAQVTFRSGDLRELSLMSAPVTRADNGENQADPRVVDGKIEMIMCFDSQATLDEICAQGGEVVSEITENIAIVKASPADAVKLAAIEGVTGVDLPRLLKNSNNESRVFSHVDEVIAGEGLSSAYDGTGVVVGVYDIGLDPNHINFKDKDGENRVKMWMQYNGTASTPSVSSTKATIQRATSDNTSQSHGTHVAGVLAGSFRDNDNDYSGMAPGAEIVMAGGAGYNVQILDATTRIAKYAKEQGKPCVINLSWGDNLGPHDGTDSFAKSLNEVAEKYDAVICMSAGNEGEDPISIIQQLTEEKPTVGTLALKGEQTPSNLTGQYYQASGTAQIWTEDGTPFEVTLDIINPARPEEVLYSFPIPEGAVGYTEAGGMTSKVHGSTSGMNITSDDPEFTKYYTSSTMGGSRGIEPANKRYSADVYLFLNSSTSANLNRYFTRITVKGKPGKKIFMYCDGKTLIFGNNRRANIDAPNGAGTHSNMGSGPNTLCVGSYITRAGGGYKGKVGEISTFSSWGETPDGRIMPDICAPGQVIVSSRNTHLATTGSAAQNYPVYTQYTDPATKKTYYWTTCAGTSQASPHMAGIVALWRQAKPELTFREIKEIARTTAAPGNDESTRWGAGRVDALAGIKKILDNSSVYDIMENAPESILIQPVGKDVYEVFAPAEDSVTATVYNLQGIAALHNTADSNSMNVDLSALPAGIYLLEVTTPHSHRTLKLRK